MATGDRKFECRIYVGNLPPDIRTRDVEDLFQKFGKISYVDLKNRKGPPFAFVEFDDKRDAEDAVKYRDGYDYDGYRLRVEFPRGNGPYTPGKNTSNFRGGSGASRGGLNSSGIGRRTNYRVIVSGLPPTGSWQDLKDHMREAGDVCYADVFKDGTGAVEYLRYEDMRYALRKLDDSKFRSHEGETSYVHVKEDATSGAGGAGAGDGTAANGRHFHSRSRSRSRSRSMPRRVRDSPTYSPAARSYRSRSRSKSRSRSLSRSRSRSRSSSR